MKKIFPILALFVAIMAQAQTTPTSDASEVTSWVFNGVPSTDIDNIAADSRWNNVTKSSVVRYQFKGSCTNEALKANNAELTLTSGLLFTIADGSTNSDGRNLYISTSGMWLGEKSVITLPSCKAGQWLQVEYSTSKDKTERSINAVNLVSTLPSTSASKTHVKAASEIAADGNVTLTMGGGMYIYTITLADSEELLSAGTGGGGGGTVSPSNPDNPQETVHEFDITQDFSKLSQKYIYKGEGAVSIYVAPDGDDANDGLSAATPLKSIQLAIDRAVDPGTTIYLAPGEYRPTDRLNINDRNGLHDKYNAMVCLDGRAIINCDHPQHGHSDNPYQGLRLTSSYWYLYHVDITNASDNGLLLERNKPANGTSADIMAAVGQAHDNIIHACNFYKNGDTGLQMKNLASYNYVINCDAYLNCDEGQGDADGFAPKISVGTGNYFFGCRAYLNSDDGWDVFYKKDGNFGDDMVIILDNCIAYKNGYLDENTIATSGNGNGFKCGSDQGAMNVYLTRCLAIMNKAKGFDQNHNSGDIILNNCTGMTSSVENGSSTYSYRIYEAISSGHKVELNNCIAINDNDEKDKRDSSGNIKPSEYGKNGGYGRFQVDETLSGLTVSNNEFQKARPEFFLSMDHTQLMVPRDANDNIPEIAFAHINPEATTSYSYKVNKQDVKVEYTAREILIDNGMKLNTTIYRELPVLPIFYNGAAPDKGAYEATGAPVTSLLQTEAKNNSITVKTIKNNKVIIIRNGKMYNVMGKEI